MKRQKIPSSRALFRPPALQSRPVRVLVACARGGAGRTTVATVLSLGVSLSGLRSHYLQVRAPWEPEYLEEIEGLPFATSSIAASPAWHVAAECNTAPLQPDVVVIDLPAMTLSRREMLPADLVLIPVRPGGANLWGAATTYMDAEEIILSGAHGQRSGMPCLIGVGWPANTSPQEILAEAQRYCALAGELGVPRVLAGIPPLGVDDLEPLMTGVWQGATHLEDIAVEVAQAVISLLRQDPS